MHSENELHKKLIELIKLYGEKDIVNHLNLILDAKDFYTARVLESLARNARKNTLQLVALVSNENEDWSRLPTFKLDRSEKLALSESVKTLTYKQVLPDFYDITVVD